MAGFEKFRNFLQIVFTMLPVFQSRNPLTMALLCLASHGRFDWAGAAKV